LEPLLQSSSARRGDAYLTLARIRARQGNVEAAAVAYGEAASSSRDPEVAGTALYERARMRWNKNDDGQATVDFEAFLARFPEHDKAPEAMHALARIAETSGDFATAARRYDATAQRYPSAQLARESAWRAAFVRHLAGDHAAAASGFAALGDDEEATYWRARALEAAGDRTTAKALYEDVRRRAPQSYLAWWVDERLGDRGAQESIGVAELPAAPAPLSSQAPVLAGPGAYHFTRGEILRALGMRPEAAREYAAVEAASGPDRFLLDLYRDTGSYPAMIKLARKLETRDGSIEQVYLYPPAFRSSFESAGARSGVDPLLLLSLSRQESLFDPNALSPAGARGLMQLMPATAAQVAGPDAGATALGDPTTNVDVGTRYLRGLLDDYDGRIVLALAAYNAGPDPVGRWQQRSFGRDGDEFVEIISFRETKGYVKAVLRNYRTYRALDSDAADGAVRLY
jgi:soluble lytic murein transglycosylase